MWRTFHHFGRVFDIYSPMRRSRNGSRFGFVRYLEVSDEKELERRLNGIRVGNSNLRVNMPKYNFQKNETAVERRETDQVQHRRSYADVVKGSKKNDGKAKVETQSKQSWSKQSWSKQNWSKPRGFKRNQYWKAKEENRNWAGLELKASKEDEEWLGSCMVGTVYSVEMVPFLQEKFYMEGYFTCKIRPMGGRLVLLEGGDKDELKDLVELAADWLGQWFEEIRPWSPSMVARERFTWIKCQGMPLNAWNHDNFMTVGCLFGKFISLDDSTSKKRRFDVARFLISTPLMEFISKTVTIKIKGILYKIRIMEEESTNSLFRLKSDCAFSEKDDSKENESWSLGSDSDYKQEMGCQGDDGRYQDWLEMEEGGKIEDDDVASFHWREEEVSVNQQVSGEERSLNLNVDTKRADKVKADNSRDMQSNDVPIERVSESLKMVKDLDKIGGGVNETDGTDEEEERDRGGEDNGLTRKGSSGPKKDEQVGLGRLNACNKNESEKDSLIKDQTMGDSGVGASMGQAGNHAIENVEPDKKNGNELDEINRKARTGNATDDIENSGKGFWEDMDSDSGRLADWMVRAEWVNRNRKSKRKKSKKTISCQEVYKRSAVREEITRKKRTKSSRSNQIELAKETLVFLQGSQSRIAGGSISDSDIINRNRNPIAQQNKKGAIEIWEFAKKIGMVADEKEEEVIQRIERMENRDQNAKDQQGEQGSAKGGEGKRRGIREMVQKEKVQFLALQETKLEKIEEWVCRAMWGKRELEWITKPSNGRSGGLLCLWEPSTFQKVSVFEGGSFLGIFGFWGKEKVPVYIVNVYFPCEMDGKRALWAELLDLITKHRGNWCVAGDFNAVQSRKEKIGSSVNAREMRDFKKFISDSGLVDLPLNGRKYTWYHASGGSMSRLDRFLVSEEWLLNWEDAKQWGLKRTISDHCPVILKNQKIDWGPKPFRFFDVWMERPGFKELVEETWKSAEVQGWKGFCLKEKLKKLKGALRNWSKGYEHEVDKNIVNAEDQIARLDLKGEGQQLTEEEIARRRETFVDLWRNMRIKNRMCHQKARRSWLREGDANTAYYHKCIKSRWRRNEICSILAKGQQCTEVDEIKREIATHFEQAFKEEWQCRPKIEGAEFKMISETQNPFLIAPFTEKEIKLAIWDCDSTKAPGPDGFNFNFIKRNWEVIKKDITEFIQEFHDKGKLVKGSNESFVVLIPKTNNPERIEEYRPISLIGIMYKILSKLLANRLRQVLDGVIGETQMAFIAGRQLPDGVVIANEVLDDAKKSKKKCFVFKADFEKAYDNVNWGFLDFMMRKLGFGEKWRSWIQECLKSASISILVNGSPSKQFRMSKGLRQGDPLSPFLFLIVAEGLNGLIMEAVRKGLLEGIQIGGNEINISHLQFADDTLLMGLATEDNIWAVKCIMRSFELSSGLKINYAKSQLMGVNVEEERLAKMAYLLNCKKGGIPFKYLGIRVGGNPRSRIFWRELIESFHKQLSRWKGQQLSMGGRITLINSVLSSLPVFQMSTHLLPKGTLSILDKIRRQFLWGGWEEHKKINWVKWESVCRRKDEGGLGVKDLRHFNAALMGKWWAKLAGNSNSLWYGVIRSKYGNLGGNWMSWVKEGKGSTGKKGHFSCLVQTTHGVSPPSDRVLSAKPVGGSFELSSGLKINYAKSQLMGVNVEEEWLAKMAYLLNCKKGGIPFKYLGIRVGGNPRSGIFWRELIESFHKQLSRWKGQQLSMGGRITLINSVLSSLPVFQMSTHFLPKGTLSILDKIRRQFLWGGWEEHKKINWVKWESVCRRKDEGGLGVKDLRHFNAALMGKWWAKLAGNSNSLWYRVIRSKYGNLGGNWMSWVKEGKGRGSKWWQDICKLNDLIPGREGWLEDNFKLSIGEGKRVCFWQDNWLGTGPLSNLYPRLFVLSTGRHNTVNQMGTWISGQWSWSLQWRRELRTWEAATEDELRRILSRVQLIQGKKDKWEWSFDTKNGYSTNVAYKLLTSPHNGLQLEIYNKVWNTMVPSKINRQNKGGRLYGLPVFGPFGCVETIGYSRGKNLRLQGCFKLFRLDPGNG
ncbi:hypothetical protein SLEP1_g32498 [Rubroshorea leprosula]|uniref:Reverse transcriptase domain-containing protein n=1 Tax=Rubroshorea leprosula TaxID=152421 RepID=A0AAV5KDH1_9ROSI|nr:hypothetical protein SLEP1_g32498 [Rubroshorea leprosula]